MMRPGLTLYVAALVAMAAGCGSDTTPMADAATVPDDMALALDSAMIAADLATGPFTLTSPVVANRGALPAEYTCDGVGHSPPLAWTGAPANTVEFALMMTTQAKDGLKWNWVFYHVPPKTTELAVGTMGVGTSGLTSDGPKLAYSPPCSQGPGLMSYTFTLYALSAVPTLSANPRDVTGAVLTAAIANLIIGQAAMTVTYTR